MKKRIRRPQEIPFDDGQAIIALLTDDDHYLVSDAALTAPDAPLTLGT